MLLEEDIKRFLNVEKEYNIWVGIIEKRFFEIVDIVLECFGYSEEDVSYWFGDYDSEIEGHIDLSYKDLSYCIYFRDDVCKDLQTDYYDYGQDIPIEFLTMSDEEIRTKVKNEIRKTKEKEEEKKAKAKANRENKKLKRQEALNKLSKEERKLLGL